MKIRFHNAIAWQFIPIVQGMIKKGYEWNTDLWGRKPAHNATYLQFRTDDIYQQALKFQENLKKLEA